MKRPIAYITAPWGENEFENTENAAKYCRAVYDAGFSPICPMLFLPLFLSDEIPQEHKDGIDMAREYLRRSHVLVVCGDTVDESMKNDIAVAERLRITATTLDGIVIYGRMIEIYLVTSVAPIPMATMMGKEWGGMGQNYIRSLLALGFQAFLIIVCVAIYAVLVQNIATEDDIIMAIWSCVGYTVLLCFTLFKTGSLAKAVFNAH